MTYVDDGSSQFGRSLVAGQAYDSINRFFRVLGRAALDNGNSLTSSQLNPLEKRLRRVQETISSVSMHLPAGFAAGLNRQFANLMDVDAWEDEDKPINDRALSAFLVVLLHTGTQVRPGIGTNGYGSITAAWTTAEGQLTVECLPSGRISFVMSRLGDDGEVERAAFGPLHPRRLLNVLAPFAPEVWFDG